MNTFSDKHFQFSPGNLQLPNSRRHPKYTSAPVSHCFPCSFTHYGNKMWLSITPRATYTNLCASNAQANATCQLEAHPLLSALTPLAHCHLPEAHSCLTLQLQSERQEFLQDCKCKCCTLLSLPVWFAQKGRLGDKVGQSIFNFPSSDTIIWGNNDVFNKSLV